ncbi:MAG: ribose-5-phosphate isomerase RpiA [Spirochaetia bacterium]|jgi:ribose 5-phosphate isomerase A|nr:ribose-5-phosphate isomerase RpiA [Spirochaetia bacterium]
MDADEIKKQVGFAAVDEFVKSGMRLGLGTGSTAVWAVRRLGGLLKAGKLQGILAVATSSQTEMECQKAGVPLRSLNDPEIGGCLDFAVDGADEVDENLNLTKGGGGALLIEKIVAYSAAKFVVVVDSSKLVKNLGIAFPVPTEVLREARLAAAKAFAALGAEAQVRMAVKKMGAVITDNGNILLDLKFSRAFDPAEMEALLSRIPGVLGNGVFSQHVAEVMVGYPDGRIGRLKKTEPQTP